MEKYQYSPLQPGELTRVLALQPASLRSDELHCQLLHISSDFPYIAISYAWGLQYGWSDLVVEDSDQHGPPSALKITTTVKLLLRRMRGSSAVRYLWIDALCINQADNAEKAQQVSRMFDIYRMASQVFAWLGNRGKHESDFLKVIKRVEVEGDDVLEQHLEECGLGPLHNFFGRSWFWRRWVIQEVAAARKAVLVDGYTHMDFESFAQTLRTSNSLRRITDSSALGFIEAISRVRGSAASCRHLSFAALFPVFHNAECKDDKDRIFSLLGLDVLTASPGMDIIMMPNYSLSTIECYETFATKLAARSTQDLFAVMQCAGAFPQDHVRCDFEPPRYGNYQRTSSWIPDWTFPRLFRPLFCSNNSLRAGFTSPTQLVGQRTMVENGVLCLDGLLLGCITHLSPLWWESFADEYIIYHALTRWLVLLESGLIDEPKYVGKTKRIVADFARTITAGQIDLQFESVFDSRPRDSIGNLPYTSKDLSRRAFNRLLMKWLRRAKLLSDENDSLVTMTTDSSLSIEQHCRTLAKTCFIEENIPSDAHPELRRAQLVMEGRTFFVTDSGHMGICSSWATTGDIVAIPFGANTPFILRARTEPDPEQAEQRVNLVSDCYVEGVMEGQAWHQPGLMRRTFVVE
ncbi:heterokaryon incompatibility protein-domain-containing protein [Paraphoma chrysanthemicola]|nr:heterokaryon incompatibility protein-domain-containing protein [Paraphoma chrysanthemicola]